MFTQAGIIICRFEARRMHHMNFFYDEKTIGEKISKIQFGFDVQIEVFDICFEL